MAGLKKSPTNFETKLKTEKDIPKIRELLATIREGAGISRGDMAARLQTKRPAINRLETKAENYTVATLVRFAEACGGTLRISFRKGK